jgi:hypothetical protein
MPSPTSALLFSYGRVPAMNHLSVWVAVIAAILIAALWQLVRLAERRV